MWNNNNKSNKEYKNKLIVRIILNTMYKIDGDTLSTSCNISLAPLASDFHVFFMRARISIWSPKNPPLYQGHLSW